MAKRRANNEGSLFYSEREKTWIAEIVLPDGKKKRKRSKKQGPLIDWLAKQDRARRNNQLVLKDNVLIGEFLDEWFTSIKSPTLRDSTRLAIESLIKTHLKPAFGNLKLTQLTTYHLDTFYARKIEEGKSTRTVQYLHTIMYQALAQAKVWKLVGENVAESAKRPKGANKKVDPLTREQIERLFEVLKDDRLFPLYVVYIGCGLRRGEALALLVTDVDMERRVIYVNKTIQLITGKKLVVGKPKSESANRTVAMPEFVRLVLAHHLGHRTVESEYLFCTSKGTPFIPRNVVRHFKRVLKKAGLPETTRIHSLRHTFVSILLKQNTPPKDVQVIAGHADFGTTMNLYGHIMPGAQHDAARRMDEFFKQ